ncbi:PEP-CTERM sorting domain-containing protein [Aphanothece sacrum]|uniref:PEP-CTERM sorting domain-containing protein n=1 Tax=Aphanothece sacrum FPU1 TaxID=1920663 RepID=A0A401IFL4_APHSA|nr:PEP-CTERM sorting domain-containing protein [Aphanothece sacrum]GBF80006.1 hypothetical protein AsFPU1_1407 [Aphanothece sacrum FPU1]GBF83774.1 hypothetical protein AsFPU3_0817 [Aphanothece sacrum FPU3]
MKRFLTQLAATSAATITLSMAIAQQAQAITFNFNWQGSGGYSATGMFGYDETTAPTIISENGPGTTNDLDFLMVSFFGPGNTPIVSPFATYNTVVNGVSQSRFFNFNFNTVTKTFFGPFDVGGGTGVIGEQFLQGTVGTLLELKQDVNQNPANPPTILSRNSGSITVTQKTPEPTSILGLLALGGLVAGSTINKKQKAK